MERLRVLVLGSAGVLREMVARAVSSQGDMALIGPAPATATVGDADVVVCIADDAPGDDMPADDDIVATVLRPNAAVVLHHGATHARFYRSVVRLEADIRGELSTSTLLDTIRHGRDTHAN